jgi:hypothetical protein
MSDLLRKIGFVQVIQGSALRSFRQAHGLQKLLK